ncbi:MAG: hypothetical protein B6241_10075 [Spirochaetaceae bacterium 4572_59]|nr:MAG: hypothetical protein B6241_10075 [Spirochaetaceae bacterium 4572_59]
MKISSQISSLLVLFLLKAPQTSDISLISSRLTMFTAGFAFKEHDIHIHVPSEAVPKDEPSAGVTLMTSLASLILGKPVATMQEALKAALGITVPDLPIGELDVFRTSLTKEI